MPLRSQFEEDCSGRSFRIIPAKRENKTEETTDKTEQSEQKEADN